MSATMHLDEGVVNLVIELYRQQLQSRSEWFLALRASYVLL